MHRRPIILNECGVTGSTVYRVPAGRFFYYGPVTGHESRLMARYARAGGKVKILPTRKSNYLYASTLQSTLLYNIKYNIEVGNRYVQSVTEYHYNLLLTELYQHHQHGTAKNCPTSSNRNFIRVKIQCSLA